MTRLSPGDRPDAVCIWAVIERVRLGLVLAETTFGPPLALPFTTGAKGGPQRQLMSHIPLSSPLARDVAAGRCMQATFLGASGYISASWYGAEHRSSAPTWNYEMVTISGRARPLSRESLISHLSELVDECERDRPDRWGVEEMGPRFDQLLARITGFEILVESVHPRMKLGQHDTPAEFNAALKALSRGTEQQVDLGRAMARQRASGSCMSAGPDVPDAESSSS